MEVKDYDTCQNLDLTHFSQCFPKAWVGPAWPQLSTQRTELGNHVARREEVCPALGLPFSLPITFCLVLVSAGPGTTPYPSQPRGCLPGQAWACGCLGMARQWLTPVAVPFPSQFMLLGAEEWGWSGTEATMSLQWALWPSRP